MSLRTLFVPSLIGAATVTVMAVSSIHEIRLATSVAAAPQEAFTSTLDNQTDLAVTVYNSDLALIRDTRTVTLPRGTGDVHFMDIAATVNPASVHFRSLSDPSRVSVVEQNYEYDLLEPEKLLRKYVGRDVTLVRRHTEQGTSVEEPGTRTTS